MSWLKNRFNNTYIVHFFGGFILIFFGLKKIITARGFDFYKAIEGDYVRIIGGLDLISGLFLISLPFVFQKKQSEKSLFIDGIAILIWFSITDKLGEYISRIIF